MNRVIYFTICNLNYLAKALTMLDSIDTNENVNAQKMIILSELLDESVEFNHLKKYVNNKYDIDIVKFDETIDSYEEMYLQYSVVEFSTALKPFVFDSLFSKYQDVDIIHYIDPDFLFLKNSILQQINIVKNEQSKIYCTPHVIGTDYMEDDTSNVTYPELLSVGRLNLGYIGISRNNGDFINEAMKLMRKYAYIKLSEGMFTDQKVFNYLIQKYYDRAVEIRNSEFNYAYWNLYERTLVSIGNKYVIKESGQELEAIHFSGFEVETPLIFTKHKFIPLEVIGMSLRMLISRYTELLMNKKNEVEKHVSNITISDKYRLVANDHFKKWFRSSNNQINKIDLLTKCINENFLFDNLVIHKDLFDAFTDSRSKIDYKRLNDWIEKYEILDNRTIYFRNILNLMQGNKIELDSTRPVEQKISLFGWFSRKSGISEFANEISRTLIENKIIHNVIDVEIPYFQIDRVSILNIWCVNADNIDKVFDKFEVDITRTYNIGVFFWEIEYLPPNFVENARLVDEIWLASEFMYKVFYDYGFRNLKIMPALNSFNPDITLPRIEMSSSGVNRILMIFDYKSSFDRKNPIDVVDIIKSLPTNLEFELVIKTINGNDFNNFRKNLINRIEKDPRIIMMEKYMSQEEINKLYMTSDIYISLHRAEGLGLNLLKALQYGLEIISTKYGGPLDFLNEKNSFLVNYDMEPIRASASGLFQYPYESNWARANADEAREILISLLNGQSRKKNIRSKAQIGHENMGNTQWQEFLMSIRKYIS